MKAFFAAAAFLVCVPAHCKASQADVVAAPTAYVLSPDDQLDISVLGHDDLKAGVTVLPDGSFDYPIVGRVHATGLTVMELTQALNTALSRSGQLNSPQVTVILRESRPRKVSVLGGGSKSPGQYDFKTGMHLLDLLAASGGPTQEPQLTQATLVTDGGKQSLPIDLAPLLSGMDAAQNLPLLPGDVLFLTARNPELAQVQVAGDVLKPGAYEIMLSGISVLSLLNQAGGALPTAALTKVQIMHQGQVTFYNLRPLLTTNLKSDGGQVRLVPGDVLLVPTNQARFLALGEVRSPGIYPLPEDQPMTLPIAYALAGGATSEGDRKHVAIIRRTLDGQTTLTAVNMDDLLQGKRIGVDIALQADDILYIQARSHPKSLGEVLASVGSLALFGSLARTGF